MKEKVLSLAKGNFIYEPPGLILTPDKLEFQVAAGERRTVTFTLVNERGTKMKGFGSVEETELEFLPVFHAEKNELKLTVNAEERVPGERFRGQIHLVTDCGEEELPYDIQVVTPELSDAKGAVKDYFMLRGRIEENPENGAKLFHSPAFKEVFLYRDEAGKLLYDHLVKKNTKIHSMEEFLVGMDKKPAIHFKVDKGKRNAAGVIEYELAGADVQDSLGIRINTWGSTGIHVTATADFIEPELHILWTDEFIGGQDVLEFTIRADKVKCGRRFGSLILETPYETREVQICAHNRNGERERKVGRAKKAAFATLFRNYLGYTEDRVSGRSFQKLLKKNKNIIEKLVPYKLPVSGYIAVMLAEEEDILEFYRQSELVDIPKLGSGTEEVENYILIQYIKYMYTQREEERERLNKLIEGYNENGYSSTLLFYLKLNTDERYQSLRIKERDIREVLEQGAGSPLLYSSMVRVYCEDATLIKSLDEVTLATVGYGLKHDLITEDIAVAISFLAERLSRFEPVVFAMLEKLYLKFQLTDTLRGICGLLIRNEMRQKKYFPLFAKGVQEHLRLTDLYEYYMYTLDKQTPHTLPDSILSYFQYENHLNESCKAFLYAYITKRREQDPETFRIYGTHIREFALKQLMNHRISEDIGVLYEGLFREENIRDSVARELPYVMFTRLLTCHNEKMTGVLVAHVETKEETYYSFTDGQAKVQIYTPNYQLYFVDEEGNYYTGTVEYTMQKLLNLDSFAILCYENGADMPQLLIHLAVEAERGARLTGEQPEILHRAVKMHCFRDYMQGKALLCLYDYYNEKKDMTGLLEVLDEISPSSIKRERLGEVATDCIYHGMYDKAEKMLLRYGICGCEKKALAMLLMEKVQEHRGEFVPVLVKWAAYLYHEKYFEQGALNYLLQYYMGNIETLTAIYKKCASIPEIVIEDGSKERLLGQVLFTGVNPKPYEKLFLEYYQNGNNRVLVKAFLSELAYEYIVDRLEPSEEVFTRIEKEAFYEKEKVMVLAALKYYSRLEELAEKQKEFVEMNLEHYAGEGEIFTFMKAFSDKVSVPYEIENAVLIQYNSGTSGGVFLFVKNDEGKFTGQPMKMIFDGIFTSELLLFEGEEKVCYIYEEETDERTEEMTVTRPERAGKTAGFFQLVNQMIKAKNTGDESLYGQLRKQYEEDRELAKRLFTIQ